MINEYLMSQRDVKLAGIIKDRNFPPNAKRIVCKDGFSLSVQADYVKYCYPKTNVGPWDEVEVGWPSATPELIMQYAEYPEKPTTTVYGYVPIELVEELIALHGGPRE